MQKAQSQIVFQKSLETGMVSRQFGKLMEAGLVYRYTPEQWQKLQRAGGKDFPAIIREVMTSEGRVVEELIQPTLEPIALHPGEWEQLQKLAGLWEKFLAAQHEIFSSDPATAQMVATPKELGSADIEPGYKPFLSYIRLDCIRDDQGKLRVVDINSTRPAGVGDNIVLRRVMENCVAGDDPMIRAFVSVIKTCFEQWSANKGVSQPARIGLVCDILSGDWWNLKILADVLAEQPWVEKAVVINDIPAEGFNCLIRSRIKESHPLFAGLEKFYPDKACIISPLHRRWAGNKIWMYLCGLEKYADIFTDHLGDDYSLFVNQVFVPTGLYANGQVSFADNWKPWAEGLSKKDWVVKTPDSSSGVGVVFGRKLSQKRWEEYLQHLPNNTVFQRCFRVKEKVVVLNKEGKSEERKMYIKYGVFFFNGKLGGIEIMARSSQLVHGARDTYLSYALPFESC